MKSANVYKRANRLFLYAESRTTAGVWIASPPFIQIDTAASLADLGRAVIAALNGSQSEIPHPTKWGNLLDPLLEQAGVKSWETFMRKAQCLNVEADGAQLKFIPNRNLGKTEGFEQLKDKTDELPSTTSPDRIGAALLKGLSLCK